MDRKEIIAMAREAECSETFGSDSFRFTVEEMERFAALVADKEREAILDEWCDRVQSDLEYGEKSANQRAAVYWAKTYPAMFGFTAAIRARSNTTT